MTVPTLVAYDFSGSTNGVHSYHTLAKRVVDEIDGPVRIVKWNTVWSEITKTDLNGIHNRLCGEGCTDVSAVANAIQSLNFKGKLLLITDGEVSEGSIDRADATMDVLRDCLSSVEVHIVKSPHATTNMSVSCPFTRCCAHTVRVYEHGTTDVAESVDVSETDVATLETLDGILSVHQFDAAHDSVLRALTARQMGRSAIDTRMHDQLVRLRGRLVAEISRKHTLDAGDQIADLKQALTGGLWDPAIEAARDLYKRAHNAPADSVESRIGELLNITKGGLRHHFSHRLRRADTVVEPPIIDLSEPNEEASATFECPITLDTERDVAILLKHAPPVFEGLSEGLVESLLNCPLNALNCPTVCDALMAAMDVAIGVPALLAAEDVGAPILTSPFTRAPIMGHLYLGAHETQFAATNAAIARLLTGQSAKKAGNLDLWFAVIAVLLERSPRFVDVCPAIDAALRWRLEHRTTFASMTGNSMYLNVRMPLGMACWTVVSAPLLHLPTKHDPTRCHAFALPWMKQLALRAGFSLPSETWALLDRHTARLTALYRLLSHCKSGDAVRGLITALTQRCHRITGAEAVGVIDPCGYCASPVACIPLDGPASAEQTAWALEQLAERGIVGDADDLVGLASMVHPNLSANDIELRVDWMPSSVAPAVAWPGYGVSTTTTEVLIPICLATARPYYGQDDGTTWKEAMRTTYGVSDTECISTHECYIRFVQRYGRYPSSVDEFIVYMHYYYVVHRGKKTLPAPTVQFARETFDSAAPVVAVLSPAEFSKRADAARPIQARQAVERHS